MNILCNAGALVALVAVVYFLRWLRWRFPSRAVCRNCGKHDVDFACDQEGCPYQTRDEWMDSQW